MNKDPIEKQWAPIVAEVCEAETDNESYCKQLKNIVDGFFFQYMRKYKRDLSVQEYHAAEVSFKHPYFAVGVCRDLQGGKAFDQAVGNHQGQVEVCWSTRSTSFGLL